MLAADFGRAIFERSAVAAVTARTLSETEGEPATWRAPSWFLNEPEILSGDHFDRMFPLPVVWRRIETWITRRWPSRPVVYVAEGPGWLAPRVHPFAISTTKQ